MNEVTKTETSEKSVSHVSDLFPAPELWADEDARNFENLRSELIADLAPGSTYQRAVAEDLVQLEWEKYRHRRMRDALLRSEIINQATSKLSGTFAILEKGPASPERKAAENIFSNDPDDHADAANALQEHGTSIRELMARAYQALARDMDHHEDRLAEIEARRRKLYDQYVILKSKHAVLVEDAETIDGA